MATTVTWVQDGNGSYEISSAEHLKQLMNQGSLYTDAGIPPTTYWDTDTNYIQTVDIDLLNDSTDIFPIGSGSFGTYDGAEFQISNWSYVDANFGTFGATAVSWYTGLFGRLLSGAILKNIRLSGLWTIEGYRDNAGFLLGNLVDYNASSSITNIVCDFSVGSYIDNNLDTRTNPLIQVGGMLGKFQGLNVEGLTIKGSIEFKPDITGAESIGGIAGEINTFGGGTKFLQNLATFPSGIFGAKYTGGLIGEYIGFSISDCINAMTGDLTGGSNTECMGGVIARIANLTQPVDNLINSMTGNISSSSLPLARGVGGVIGSLRVFTQTLGRLINYMSGDISAASGYLDVGGLIGHIDDDPGSELNNSINAMNGDVLGAIIGVQLNSNLVVSGVGKNIDFGLTFTDTDTTGVSSPSDMLSNTSIPELPYTLLSGTDSDGNSYDFGFIYANLGGSSVYTGSTHLVIQGGVPNFQNGAVFVFTPLLSDSRPVNIPVVIGAVVGAIGYQITYQGPTGGEVTVVSNVTTLEHNIVDLVPETTYTIRLYVDTGSGYQLIEELMSTTLSNTSSNYNKDDFSENGIIDLTPLSEDTISNINEVMDELFQTGDIVQVDLPTKSKVITSFINLGDILSIKDINGVLLPFESTGGNGQDVNVIYSDDVTTEAIVYDEVNNNITVESVTYSPGESFVINGLKATVLEY